MSNEITVESFQSSVKGWAKLKVPLQSDRDCYDPTSTWHPISSRKPKKVKTNISLFQEDSEWTIVADGEKLLSRREFRSAIYRFNHWYRYRYLRPDSLPLLLTDDQAEELIRQVVDPKTAVPGDYVLCSRSYPIYDVIQVDSLDRKKRLVWIVGDSLEVSASFLKSQHYAPDFRRSVSRLRAPVVGALAPNPTVQKYPDAPIDYIPGRPNVKIGIKQVRADEPRNNYVHCYLWVKNESTETVKVIGFQWDPNVFVESGTGPFAYQNGVALRTFAVGNYYDEFLYPDQSIEVDVCIGRYAPDIPIDLFIPARYFSGFDEAYIRIKFEPK
jgi:hypothetical protein